MLISFRLSCVADEALIQKHIITARVAKRAKVMFSQAFVCPSPGGGGGRWHTKCNLGPGQNIYPPPPHLRLGQNVYLSPHTWDLVRMSTPPPETWSECLPPPHLRLGQNVYPPTWDLVRMSTPPPPLGPGQNVYPPTWDLVRISTPPPGTRSECLPPPPPPETWSECLPPPPHLRLGQNVYPPTWDLVRMSTSFPPPETTRRRAVRILLECILVKYILPTAREGNKGNVFTGVCHSVHNWPDSLLTLVTARSVRILL